MKITLNPDGETVALVKAGLTLIKKDEFGKEITEKSLRINYTVKKNG